jgi:ATP-dependent DNA ligase
MRIKRGPAGFAKSKHDGYRLIVRGDRPTLRLFSRNAHGGTFRLPTIADAAERIKAKRFTIEQW